MEGHEILKTKLLPLHNFLKKNSINEHNIEWLKNYLGSITFISGLTYKEKISNFQRVTINTNIFGGENKRITEINYLKNPPKDLIKRYGRANFPNESILYATFDAITALSEMRPKNGDLITISKWRLKTDYDLTVTPVFKNTTKNGDVHNGVSLRANIEYQKQLRQIDEHIQKQLDIIIQFIADCFNKDVNDDNHLDYFLSSYYANRLLWELQNGEIDAILYPSVRQSLTLTNIALKPEIFDANYELESVQESIVKQNLSPNSSGWFMEGTGNSTTFKDNIIIWD